MTTSEIVAANANSSVLDHWTKEQLKIITDVIAPGLANNPGELRLFLHTAHALGLDPLRRQIHPVMRWDSKLGRERMTIQTGIDGYRAISGRQKDYAGQTAPEWCGKDGIWRDVWLADEPPHAARVGILRHSFKEPAWGVARYSAYVQKDKNGNATKFWRDMAAEQLAKVAEALGHRKAFPEDLSGIYTHEEMAQADGPRDAEILDDGAKPGAQRQADRLAAKARAASAPEAPATESSTASAQLGASQEPREVVAEEPSGAFAAGDESGTGAITPEELAAYIDPAQTAGLQDYRNWPDELLAPWDSWKDEPLAKEGKKLNRWTAAEFVQGEEGGGRHAIASAILEKLKAEHGPATVPEGALRLDYCLAVMRRRWAAMRHHHQAAATAHP